MTSMVTKIQKSDVDYARSFMKRGPCKGLCEQYVASRPSNGNRYASGQSRCQTCEIFLKPEGVEDGIICKCCHMRVRNKPRNSLYKEKFHNAVKKKHS